MCGLAGIVAWDEHRCVGREVLEQMSARIAHRGPDGQGFFLTPGGAALPQVGLVHRRLAILDPDPRANQPFTDHRGRWIVFNGEIYNFRELRSELSRLLPTYAWRTTGDTEVLLAAFEAWGERCVDHLEGMYALAVWDRSAGSLLLARDRMGQKPLYLAAASVSGRMHTDGPWSAVAFASEIPALLAVPWVDRRISTFGLVDYLNWGCAIGPETIHRGIHRLPPGQVWSFTHRLRTIRTYFKPNRLGGGGDDRPTRKLGDSDAVSRTRELVRRAVQSQLVSDVPVGCFLSGGVDSSIVAAAMRAALPPGAEPPLTFSMGFDDPRYDERPYAAAVAKHLGTRHHEFLVRPDAAADLPKVAAAFGEPFGDSSSLPTYYLARETRQHVKVCLSGDGGDELFCGYDRYRAMALAHYLQRGIAALPLAAAGMIAGLFGTHPKSTAARIRRFTTSLLQPDERRYALYLQLDGRPLPAAMFDPALVRLAGLISPDIVRPYDVARQFRRFMRATHGDVVRAAMAVDRITYLPCDLLTKVDRCSMAFALEVRSPFMDHRLVRFAASLNRRQLLAGGPKRMLREAFAVDLPPAVFARKKMGFAVPIGDWFRGSLRSLLHDALFAADSFASRHFNAKVVRRLVDDHDAASADHSQRLYALLMLELWWASTPRGS